MTLAHIHNGAIIRRYAENRGRVRFVNGDTVSPAVAGTYGDEKLLPVVSETVDNSTTTDTTQDRETLIETDRVIDRTIIRDMTQVEIGEAEADRRANMKTTRMKFALAAHAAGIITESEAIAWAGGASLPASIETIFDSLPAEQRLAAKIEALTVANIRRTAPLIEALRSGLNVTEAEADALFA